MCNCYSNTNSKIRDAFAAGASDEVFDAIAAEVRSINERHSNQHGYLVVLCNG